MERIEQLLQFTLTPGIGTVTVNRLLETFGSADAILGAREEELCTVPGIGKAKARAVLAARETDPRHELELAADAGIDILAYDDPLFPKMLREGDIPPYLLYVRGELALADNAAIGIVGTRRCSRYGREQAERFGADLARAGYTVVSGLARGIDSFAHRGALNVRGRTIAVVGNGLSHVYPPENRDLALEIAHSGAVVSEFPMETGPTKDTFPRRNRIIAGWSLGVLVVEAPLRSGALITARQCNEMGRDVFAIPGRIDQESAEGCHKLIRDGATLTVRAQDILDEIDPAVPRTEKDSSSKTPTPARQRPRPPAPQPVGSSAAEAEAAVLALIRNEAMHIDQIAAEAKLKIAETSATLLILELKGLVDQQPGKFFIARR